MPRKGVKKKIEKKYADYEEMLVEKTVNKIMLDGMDY